MKLSFLTEELEYLIMDRWKRGWTRQQIMDGTGASRWNVIKCMKRNGVRGHGVKIRSCPEVLLKMYQAGATWKQMRAATGLGHQGIGKRLRAAGYDLQRGKLIKPDLRWEIAKRYKEGVTITALCKRYHLSRPSIRLRLVRAGVYIRPARGRRPVMPLDGTRLCTYKKRPPTPNTPQEIREDNNA